MTRRAKPWRLASLLVAVTLLAGLGSLAWALTSPVRLVSPKAGAVLKGTASIQGAINASGVTFVILGVDNQRCFSTNAAPYSFSLDTTELADGPHMLFVEAYGRGGMIGRSVPVKVFVKNTTAKRAPKPVQAPTTMQVKSVTTPAVASTAPNKPTVVGTMPMALSAEPKITSQAVSLPPITQPVPKALTSEPKLTPATVMTAALRPSPVTPRLAPAALAVVGVPPAKPFPNSVAINDKPVPLDLLLRQTNGTFDVGFRGILTSAGWKVYWVPSRQAGKAEVEGHVLEIVLGKNQVVIDGKSFPLGRKVTMTNNRLLVALRPLCQAAGITVIWDQKTRTAKLLSPYTQNATVSLAK